jgi:hypothetical protein
LIDADVKPGHAYVEVSGARIDVGEQARIALVRAALGLDRDSAMADHDQVSDQGVDSQIEDDVHFEDSDALEQYDAPSAGLDDEVKPE